MASGTLSLDIPTKPSTDNPEGDALSAAETSTFAGSVEVGAEDPSEITEETTKSPEDGSKDDTTSTEEADTEGDGAEEEGSEDTTDEADLPDYDPDNEEARAAYDAKYFDKDGVMNRDALSVDFWKAYDAAPDDKKAEARLPDNVKKYLSDVTGFDASAIDDITTAVRDQTLGQQRAFKDRFGGEAAVDAALAWGSKNYTDAQKERFAAAQAKGFNSDEAAEQLEILINRAGRAGALKNVKPTTKSQPGDNRRPRRPASPARNVTGHAQAQPSADVFKSVEEFDTAWAEALKSKNEQKIAYVRRKLKRSPAAQTRT